jgi:uncharacterized membrane protein HdeD (DUF308 family)
MDKKLLLTSGIVGIVVGSICLFLSGSGVSMVTDLVGGVFVLAGLIAIFFKEKHV